MPAVCVAAALLETTRCVAVSARTVVAALVPATPAEMLSVAVTVRLPAVFKVTPFANVWTPASVPGTKV